MQAQEQLPPIPPAEAFVAAFRRLEGRLSSKQLAMLSAHYRAQRCTLTAAELAAAAGSARYQTTNSVYGRLGRMLGDQLGYHYGQRSYTIASFVQPGSGASHWRWTMHEEVAEALATLGWFEGAPSNSRTRVTGTIRQGPRV